jgi:hypothetical protein
LPEHFRQEGVSDDLPEWTIQAILLLDRQAPAGEELPLGRRPAALYVSLFNLSRRGAELGLPGQDNGCAAGEVQLLTDPQGDGKQPCSGHNTRAYCCTPVGMSMTAFCEIPLTTPPTGDAYQAVPFDDIFDPSQVVQGAETFDVEFDPDQGPNTGAQDAGTTTNGMKTDEKENDEGMRLLSE